MSVDGKDYIKYTVADIIVIRYIMAGDNAMDKRNVVYTAHQDVVHGSGLQQQYGLDMTARGEHPGNRIHPTPDVLALDKVKKDYATWSQQ